MNGSLLGFCPSRQLGFLQRCILINSNEWGFAGCSFAISFAISFKIDASRRAFGDLTFIEWVSSGDLRSAKNSPLLF